MSSAWLTLDWLNNNLGEEAAKNLIENFGGRSVYIPQDVYDNHILTKTVGHEAMRFLVEHFKREYVGIPKGLTSRKPRIMTLFQDGLSKREIARRLGVTDRYVRQVVNPSKKPKHNRKKPVHQNQGISEDVRFFASACGLSPKRFIKQAFDLLRLSDDMPIEQQLAIWKQRQRAVAKQVDQCERMALEQRLKNQR